MRAVYRLVEIHQSRRIVLYLLLRRLLRPTTLPLPHPYPQAVKGLQS